MTFCVCSSRDTLIKVKMSIRQLMSKASRDDAQCGRCLWLASGQIDSPEMRRRLSPAQSRPTASAQACGPPARPWMKCMIMTQMHILESQGHLAISGDKRYKHDMLNSRRPHCQTGRFLAVATHRTAHWNSPIRLSHVRDSSAPQVASVSTPSLRIRAFRGVFLPAYRHATTIGRPPAIPQVQEIHPATCSSLGRHVTCLNASLHRLICHVVMGHQVLVTDMGANHSM